MIYKTVLDVLRQLKPLKVKKPVDLEKCFFAHDMVFGNRKIQLAFSKN